MHRLVLAAPAPVDPRLYTVRTSSDEQKSISKIGQMHQFTQEDCAIMEVCFEECKRPKLSEGTQRERSLPNLGWSYR
jgi:hypothetical protein